MERDIRLILHLSGSRQRQIRSTSSEFLDKSEPSRRQLFRQKKTDDVSRNIMK